ncbi:MAG: multicopper oxidase domain-containing protein [Desulfuromonadales bacterium]|nr:multicopper oxidase domain-containing protein [Desulfuromonadales bacterium]
MSNRKALVLAGAILLGSASVLFAAPVPGGTLNPATITKYVTPLVIPPVMDDAGTAAGLTSTPNTYDIAVREFLQQILPAPLPPTKVWSYGPAADPVPAVAAPATDTQFNYPAYTIETTSGTAVNVRWRNDLVAIDPATRFPYPEGSASRTFLPHLFPVDQTLHWANPTGTGCLMGTPNRTDCHTDRPDPYLGPVPIVTHLHGAHVDPHSDGYPEAWWLPKASDIPAGYITEGSFFDDALGQVPANSGYADFSYRNDQPASTLWYHDHTLGMTRTNVYAGPAGFWLIRGGVNDTVTGLPGPAPTAGQTVAQLNTRTDPVRQGIREIPVVIQDRSFNTDGSLFYPQDRAFFEGILNNTTLGIPFIGNPAGTTAGPSDISPIWNPEAFFNTMVVNGTTWPTLDVAPAIYRLRLLNGCNSRFLNLALFKVKPLKKKPWQNSLDGEVPFYQIGAEQGFLPKVVQIQTGFATPLTPGVPITMQAQLLKAPNRQQALLLGLAERADVLVDFRGLPAGTRVRMTNTAPDAPFGGFPDIAADPNTTGQVMEFVVNPALLGTSPTDPGGISAAANPWDLVLPAEARLGAATVTRQVSLNEEMSGQVCVSVGPTGTITYLPGIAFDPMDPMMFMNACAAAGGVPFGPKAAKLGTVSTDPATGAPIGVPRSWDDMEPGSVMANVNLQNGGMRMVNVTENPTVGSTEQWDIYNFTVDGHPIHVHLVRFEVVARAPIGTVPVAGVGVLPGETGYKDTVIALPGQVTRIKATFDVAGLYVWHCHIVEHEDNEMMRPYVVSP